MKKRTLRVTVVMVAVIFLIIGIALSVSFSIFSEVPEPQNETFRRVGTFDIIPATLKQIRAAEIDIAVHYDETSYTRKWWLSKSLNGDSCYSTIKCYEVVQDVGSLGIAGEVIRREGHQSLSSYWSDVWVLIIASTNNQNGLSGPLTTRGINLFFIPDDSETLRSVVVKFHFGRWHVSAENFCHYRYGVRGEEGSRVFYH